MFSPFSALASWDRYAESAYLPARFRRTRFFLISSYINKGDYGG